MKFRSPPRESLVEYPLEIQQQESRTCCPAFQRTSLKELGHGGSRDPKRGWDVQKWREDVETLSSKPRFFFFFFFFRYRLQNGPPTANIGYGMVHSLQTLVTERSTHCKHWLRNDPPTANIGYGIVDSLKTLVTEWSTRCKNWLWNGPFTANIGYRMVHSLQTLLTE